MVYCLSMLFKLYVQGNVFDSNCIEMGVETVEMGWEDGKLSNNTKLVSIEKSRDLLFTSAKGITSVYVIKEKISIVIVLRWV